MSPLRIPESLSALQSAEKAYKLSVLCSNCRKVAKAILTNPNGSGTASKKAITYNGSITIRDSANLGCHLCSSILRVLNYACPDLIEPRWSCTKCTRALRGFTFHCGDLDGDENKTVVFRCYSPSAWEKSGAQVLDRKHSPENSEIVCQWLRACDETHGVCVVEGQTTEWHPTRLLEIKKGQDRAVSSIRVRTDFSESERPRYVTLSHCWGKSLPLRLLESTLSAYQQCIPLHQLPKTFLDAAKVALGLGISYIWIDSLCIIQDSESDWLHESALMASVYANSYLNIGAASSNSSAGSLLHERDPRDLGPCVIGSEDTEKHPDLYLLTEAEPIRAIVDSPLHKRAWVLQEQCLAPRTLYFTSTQLFWECAELCASETYPRGVHDFPAINPNHPGCVKWLKRGYASPSPDMGADWFNYVTVFLRRKLTYNSDRLPAISALARLVRDRWHANEMNYLAGLWRGYLPEALLWSVVRSSALETGYVAPSWSWASVNGVVHMHSITSHMDSISAYRPSMIKPKVILIIIEAKTTPKEDPLGQVVSGHLRVKGRIAKLHFPIPTTSYRSGARKPNIEELDSTPTPKLVTHLDPLPLSPSYHHKGHFFFLEVLRSDWSNGGLVLEHVPLGEGSTSRGLFRRVGMFAAEADEMNHKVVIELDVAYSSRSLAEDQYEEFEQVGGEEWYTVTII